MKVEQAASLFWCAAENSTAWQAVVRIGAMSVRDDLQRATVGE